MPLVLRCRPGLEFNFVDMPAAKTCDVSSGFLVAAALCPHMLELYRRQLLLSPPSFAAKSEEERMYSQASCAGG